MKPPEELIPDAIEADYVIIGAGAIGMAFADTMLSDTDATMIMVDRRHKPGGHWHDAYPFVRLHGPSANYGVNSRELGAHRVDEVGLNRGLHELASGPEICAYFDQTMRQRFLPSGRITYLPLSDCADGVVTSRVSGARLKVRARKRIVDATVADTRVPATHPPDFSVTPGVRCLTPNQLVRLTDTPEGYVIIGAGKTAMDAVVWLLEQGASPAAITWLRPREAWILNRRTVQPTFECFADTIGAIVRELEIARDAHSLDDLYARLEEAGLLLRIDRGVTPTMYRCAIVSEAELAELRRVENVVRSGHVLAIEPDRILMQRGEIPTSPRHVHVNCTGDGLLKGPPQPVFQPDRIVLQYTRRCSPTFSAAFIAHIEATIVDDAEKNALCAPVPIPREPRDWLRMQLADARNRQAWSRHPALEQWLAGARLDAFTGMIARATAAPTPESAAILARYREAASPAFARMTELLHGAA